MSHGGLGPLGLTGDEERLYRELLDRGSADLGPDAEHDQQRAVLESLVERGLVVRDDQGVARVAPPAGALGSLALHRMDELRDAQRQIELLVKRYESQDAGARSPLIEVVRGAETMATRYALALRSAREEVCSLVKAPAIITTPEDNEGQRHALGSGVRFRVVYDRAALETGAVDFPTMLKELASMGEEMRVAFDVPFKVAVIDRQTVVLIHAEPSNPYFVLVREPLLAAVCQWVFETVWDWGLPVPEALAATATDELSADERELLALLLAGHTDESVAKALDVSPRTVQRRVQRLLRLAGAQSRIQLGWHAARRQWV